LPGQTEPLDIRPDDLLIGGTDGSTKLFTYNVSTKQVVSRSVSVSPYNDIESITWPECLKTGTQSSAKLVAFNAVSLDTGMDNIGDLPSEVAHKLQPNRRS